MSLRGILTGALALIVLQVFTSEGPAGKASGLLGLVTTGIDKVLSPDVAAIPDHSRSNKTSTTAAPAFETTPPKPAQNTTIGPFINA